MLRGHCDRLRNFFSLVFVIHFFVLCSTLLGVNCGQFWYFGTLSGVNVDNFGIMALFQLAGAFEYKKDVIQKT